MSGWRPYPGEEIERLWFAAGGFWQLIWAECRPVIFDPYGICAWHRTEPTIRYRPVHPDHDWNHYPWMWAELTGEDMTPTEPGWHWRKSSDTNIWKPVLVVRYHQNNRYVELRRYVPGVHWGDSLDGQWGGRIGGMPK